MTAAGIALIAGGLATLVGFRRALWAGGVRRRPLAVEPARPAELTAAPAAMAGGVGLRQRVRPAGAVPDLGAGISPGRGDDDPVDRFGLASIGLADDEPDGSAPEDEVVEVAEPAAEELANVTVNAPAIAAEERLARAVLARSYDTRPELAEAFEVAAEPAPAGQRHGDRVDDWVRPQYESDVPSGDYWTPILWTADAELDGSGYGWPVPVERLPEVPPPPGSAAEPAGEAEPTAVVLQWPPVQPSARIELPRKGGEVNGRPLTRAAQTPWDEVDRDGRDGWERAGGRARDDAGPGDREPQRQRRRAVALRRGRPDARRRVSAVTEYIPAIGDSTQMLPSLDGYSAGGPEAEPRARPRPRPRPNLPAEARSTVYVSRHAAEPS